MSWFEEDPNRLLEEQEAIGALWAKADWLTRVEWRIDPEERLCVDFDMAIGAETKTASMRYPKLFPFAPPSVFPPDGESWSSHQYNNGELCLERGPDNWTPETLGVVLIESTYRLLELENEKDGRPIPSRHRLTEGQALRSEFGRLVATAEFRNLISKLPEKTTVRSEFTTRLGEKSFVAIPTRLWMGENEAELSVAKAPLEGKKFRVDIFACPVDFSGAPPFTSADFLRTIIGELGYVATSENPEEIEGVSLVHANRVLLFFFFLGNDKLLDFQVLEEDDAERSSVNRKRLARKIVTIVGCGSLGSKVAASLARSGVRRFCLIDDEVLMPENLQRHELDWSGVGEHKVFALERHLKLITPDVDVIVRPDRIGGQAASSSFASILDVLNLSHLIIDATANPDVFNSLASVVNTIEKAMVWGQIYGGGVGGLIARSKPGLDPSPQAARKKILAACEDIGIPARRVIGRPYAVDVDDAPMIAEDADVGVIAAHLASLALDILNETAPSRFPASAYLIGMGEGWIFEQPFHTRPIDLGGPEHRSKAVMKPEAMERVNELLKARDGLDPAAA